MHLLPPYRYYFAIVLDLVLITIVIINGIQPIKRVASPLIEPFQPLHPLAQTESKKGYEVMGFAPFWTFDKLDNVDFNVLTTFAYFGVPVLGSGDLDRNDAGYHTFISPKATGIFKKAHRHGTRVVLTLTQMNNGPILNILDSPQAQANAIDQAAGEVKRRGIDGVNVDFEYSGNPGGDYRERFSRFVGDLTVRMHQEIPGSKVTVSVYAASAKEPKLYDIASLAKNSDGIFMMAYDFAVAGADQAIPTAPLYGHKSGKYWYDISTAVEDFLSQMPPEKLILGVPYYGYNYLVYQPEIKAATRPYYSYRGKPVAQTYSIVQDHIPTEVNGWDEEGMVGWKAYYSWESGTWRMIFLDDVLSLGLKYDFAKDKNLAGVGVWALGFDEGKTELWSLLQEKFGVKNSADSRIHQRLIQDVYAGEE